MKRFCAGDIVPGSKLTFRVTKEEGPPAKPVSHSHHDHRLMEITAAIVQQCAPALAI